MLFLSLNRTSPDNNLHFERLKKSTFIFYFYNREKETRALLDFELEK